MGEVASTLRWFSRTPERPCPPPRRSLETGTTGGGADVAVHEARFASLAVGNYRTYFICQSLSASGTWIQAVAFSWLALELTRSGTGLGLVSACQFAPQLLLGPFGGILADHFSRRRLVFVTQGLFLVIALGMGVLVTSHLAGVWVVYVAALATGIVTTVDYPARQSYVAEMVGHDLLPNAVTLSTMADYVARIVGFTIGGFLIASFGNGPCFFFNAASFAVFLVGMMRVNPEAMRQSAPRQAMRGQLWSGLRLVVRTPVLRNVLLVVLVVGTTTFEWQVVLPLLARFTFHSTAQLYGLLMACMAVGAFIGGLLTAHRVRDQRGMMVSCLALGLSVLAAAVAPTLLVEEVALVLAGAAAINFIVNAASTLQLEAPIELRGRVLALYVTGISGSTAIGAPIVGAISSALGPRWGLGFGGLAALLTAALGWRQLAVPSRAGVRPSAAAAGAAAIGLAADERREQ